MKNLRYVLLGFGFCALSAPASSCTEPVSNKVMVSSENRLLWNGSEIDRPTLIRYLEVTKVMFPQPSLFADYQQGANCGIVKNVFRTIALTSNRSVSFSRGIDYESWKIRPPEGQGCSVHVRREMIGEGICGMGGERFFLQSR